MESNWEALASYATRQLRKSVAGKRIFQSGIFIPVTCCLATGLIWSILFSGLMLRMMSYGPLRYGRAAEFQQEQQAFGVECDLSSENAVYGFKDMLTKIK